MLLLHYVHEAERQAACQYNEMRLVVVVLDVMREARSG